MGWTMAGRFIDACSCKAVCPCLFGPAKPDQGWCSGALGFDIREGKSNGVSLAGTKAVMVLDLPGDFAGGNATVRLYIGDDASPKQRSELKDIFQGKRGGGWGAVAGLVTKWLPVQYTRIDLTGGDQPGFTVPNVGVVALQYMKTADGKKSRVVNPPALAVLGIGSEDMARSDGSRWSDPQMRAWKGGGAGGVARFKMSA